MTDRTNGPLDEKIEGSIQRLVEIARCAGVSIDPEGSIHPRRGRWLNGPRRMTVLMGLAMVVVLAGSLFLAPGPWAGLWPSLHRRLEGLAESSALLSENDWVLTVETAPRGAMVYLDGVPQGIAPIGLNLPAREDVRIVVRLGAVEKSALVKRSRARQRVVLMMKE